MDADDSGQASWLGPGILLVLITALVSGVSTFINAYAVQGTSSDAFVTVRNVAVAFLLVPIALIAGRTFTQPLRRVDWARLAVIGLIGGAIPFLLFFHGLQIATAAHGAATATFGYRTLFLMATVFGVVFLGERLHGRLLGAAALLLVGNVLLISFTTPIWTDGTAYVLAATLLWAGEYTLSRRTLRYLPSTTVALGRMGFGAVFLVGYLAFAGELGRVGTFSGMQWGWVVISAVLLCAFVGTFYAGLKRVELGVATSALVLGFPITWALTLIAKGGAPTIQAAAGATAIVAGVALAIGWSSFRATWRYVARAVTGRAATG
jgi:drug/metabolite transporter (DMT)-like permease